MKYSSVFCAKKSSHSAQHKVLSYIVCTYLYIFPQWILYVEHCGKIYLHKVHLYYKYFMLNTVGRFIDTKYWGILYVAHCGKIYLHKVLQKFIWINLPTVFNITYSPAFCVNKSSHSVQHKVNTVVRFIYTNYWGILYVEHCGKIYLHKVHLYYKYFMLNTVGRFIDTTSPHGLRALPVSCMQRFIATASCFLPCYTAFTSKLIIIITKSRVNYCVLVPRNAHLSFVMQTT
jgi:hypothetical protein